MTEPSSPLEHLKRAARAAEAASKAIAKDLQVALSLINPPTVRFRPAPSLWIDIDICAPKSKWDLEFTINLEPYPTTSMICKRVKLRYSKHVLAPYQTST